jgi:hypothetical protein
MLAHYDVNSRLALLLCVTVSVAKISGVRSMSAVVDAKLGL